MHVYIATCDCKKLFHILISITQEMIKNYFLCIATYVAITIGLIKTMEEFKYIRLTIFYKQQQLKISFNFLHI